MIGLEVHAQLATKTKLFCGCATYGNKNPNRPKGRGINLVGIFKVADTQDQYSQQGNSTIASDEVSATNDIPNTRTCAVCLGHPGSKPVLNEKALEHATKLCMAVKSSIAKKIIFSRKTYFYPDMSKNFQITQYEAPLGTGGSIILDSGKEIKLKRVHVEEDPAALIHSGDYVLVDYNRSGNPLVEIVTEPVLSSPQEARDLMKKLITILNYLKIFDITTCILKADANVSIRKTGFIRVEIKNITGFKEIEKALTYELKRQELHEVKRETRGWDAEKGITFSMRSKEYEEDYGYIYEPDLPTYEWDKEHLKHIEESIPELADERIKRMTKQYKIDEITAKIICADLETAELFERVIKHADPVLASNWFRRELMRVLNSTNKSVMSVKEQHLIELLEMIQQHKITDRIGQKLMEVIVETNASPKEYVKKEGLEAIEGELEIKKLCEEAVKENPKAVEDYKKGGEKAFQFLIGQVMKKAKGKAVPEIINKLMKNIVG